MTTSSFTMSLVSLVLLLFYTTLCTTTINFPTITFAFFSPKGVRISIPDFEGLKAFTVNGNINKNINFGENGTISETVTKKDRSNVWFLYYPDLKVEVGDNIFYWAKIKFMNEGFIKENTRSNRIIVKKLIPYFALCEFSRTFANDKSFCTGRLVFNETFDQFNSKLWSWEYKLAGSPDYEFVSYSSEETVANISDGYLKIQPKPYIDELVNSRKELNLGHRCTGVHGTSECEQQPVAYLITPPIHSAQISTKAKWSFKYGHIEIRAKLPKGDWIYPELFLNSANEEYGPDYSSGQIRIAFVQGNQDTNHILQGGCILGNNAAGRNFAIRRNLKNQAWSDDFHIFTVWWKPDQIELSVDGEIYGNIYPPEGGFVREGKLLGWQNSERWKRGTEFAPFDREMYLVIGVGVGGYNFEDGTDNTKPWKNGDPKAQKHFYEQKTQWFKTWAKNSSLYVDYVKIWSL